MGIQINGQTDTVTSTTAGGSVTVTPLAASSGLNVGTGASISSPATNVLVLGTNNSERVRINSSGNTGIGTNNPTSRLHVYNGDISITAPTNTNANLYLFNNAAISNAFRIGQGWSGNDNIGFLLNVANADMVLGTNNTERARITGVGSFGIGTNDPKSLLHLEGSDGVAQIRLQRASTNIYGIIRQSSAPYGITYDAVDVNTGAPTHTFRTSADGSTFSSRVTIDSSGRFGINTQSPSDRLHCDGTLRLGDNTWYHTIGAGTGNTEMVITANAGQGNATTAGTIIFKNSISAGAITERVRITSAGWSKISNFGLYNDVNASYHEFNSNQNNWTVYLRNTNASPTGLRINYDTDSNGTGNEFLYCVGNATLRASIRSNGGLANFSANNSNLSDRNVKKDITPAADTWDCVKEWEIVNYRYKDQSDESDLNLGVIAQQVAEHCPEVITVFEEAKDDQPEKLGVKEQQMYWMAIKALQEAQVRIETLEAEVAELKSKVI